MTKQRILQHINAQYKAQQARAEHDFESRLEVALKDDNFKGWDYQFEGYDRTASSVSGDKYIIPIGEHIAKLRASA